MSIPHEIPTKAFLWNYGFNTLFRIAEVFTRFPFASADSTNIAQNIGIDSAWKGTYTPPTKEARAAIMRERIESQQSAIFWDRKTAPIQTSLFREPA